ncbi:cupin domain-containing protein [Synechococcus sp. GFB01]|uniref:cupin domain-containing protein n=1 Tax=Synechococcus sp. GFB01 TaxID=1662190 RepID=UPI000B066AF3|nr:cupin domain-containing protein [Synechococcus sp. GFB01]
MARGRRQPAALAASEGPGSEVDGVRVETLARSSKAWTGEPLPAYPRGQPLVTVLRITIPAGASLGRHQHPVINAGVLLQGRLRVVLDNGSSRELRAGDALIEVVNRIHRGESLGPDPAVIVVVYAGAEGLPITIPPEPAGPSL